MLIVLNSEKSTAGECSHEKAYPKLVKYIMENQASDILTSWDVGDFKHIVIRDSILIELEKIDDLKSELKELESAIVCPICGQKIGWNYLRQNYVEYNGCVGRNGNACDMCLVFDGTAQAEMKNNNKDEDFVFEKMYNLDK